MVTINFQVVWGKVKGYPWWPGVNREKVLHAFSSSGRTLSINLSSADLSSKHIQDFHRSFSKYSKVQARVNSNKHLRNCIEAARELSEGKLDFSQINEINSRLIQSKNTPYIKINKEIEPKITELKQLIRLHDRIELEQVGLDTYKHYEKVLSDISNDKSIESNIANLCEVLIGLAKIQVNKKLLKKLHIEKLLTAISVCCSKSPIEKVKELGNHVIGLKGAWTQKRKSSGVVDFRLRVIVCKKISFILQENGFCPKIAREIALSVEEKLRKLDPTMDVKYKNCYKMMIRDLRSIKYEDYTSINKRSL